MLASLVPVPSFMRAAPGRRSTTSSMMHSMLPWIARIVYHDMGGRPVGEVAATLYADIQELVSAGM